MAAISCSKCNTLTSGQVILRGRLWLVFAFSRLGCFHCWPVASRLPAVIAGLPGTPDRNPFSS